MMTVSELQRRCFFKVIGKYAVSSAANALPTLANTAPTSVTNLSSDDQTVDLPLVRSINSPTDEDSPHQSFMSSTFRNAALTVSVAERHTKNDVDTPLSPPPIGIANVTLNHQIKIGVTLEDIHGRSPL
ncbi:hypothetical protein ISX50_12140 [Vibrio cyclitrophicus]|nr:hypothetical protein [Vibrio cyclitrophicus]UPR33826.1 hypothetical protein ISX50_12140 [Vibrio cyclitrophicus]